MVQSELVDYAADDVETLLESLVKSRVVLRRASARSGPDTSTAALLADLGLPSGEVIQRLAALRIGVIGSNSLADSISAQLANLGVGRVERYRHPEDGAGNSSERQQAKQLTKAAIAADAGGLDLMIAAVDQRFLAARHWVNLAALASGCPALFLDLSATEAVVGPLVLPGESGCYMCFRMRQIATSDNFVEVMSHERHCDQVRQDCDRLAFPGLAACATGIVLGEAFRLLFGPLMPALPNAVLQIDALTCKFQRHEVLRHPECPHCHGIDSAVRVNG
jgi:bacteriocin biosynthesis cyclodehydratase domain-containing protein